MDKLHCDIVKDLLPLYVEDVCSEESEASIRKHLETCEACRNYYEMLKEETPKIENEWTSGNLRESEFIKGIEKKLKKKITFNRIVAGFVVFLVFVIGSSLYSGYLNKPGFKVSGLIDTENITITDLYRLENGDIFFTARSNKKITWPYVDAALYDEEKDLYYASCMYTYSWVDDHLKDTGTLTESSFICSPVEKNVDGDIREISEIRFEGKNNKSIVVWKKGQELEMAPEEIEEEVEKLRTTAEDERGVFWIFTENALETLE